MLPDHAADDNLDTPTGPEQVVVIQPPPPGHRDILGWYVAHGLPADMAVWYAYETLRGPLRKMQRQRAPGAGRPSLDLEDPEWRKKLANAAAMKARYSGMTWEQVAAHQGWSLEQIKHRRRVRQRELAS